MIISCFSRVFLAERVKKDLVRGNERGENVTAILSGHIAEVASLTFLSDGTLLISGSADQTLKLWDVQTGGVIKTLCDHTGPVNSVSISSNHTTIASGSKDHTIHLRDIQTGKCHCIIKLQ